MVKYLDGLSLKDCLGKEEQGHIGSSPGTIDCKKTQANGRNTKQVTVGMGHQFIALFTGSIKAYRVIHIGTD